MQQSVHSRTAELAPHVHEHRHHGPPPGPDTLDRTQLPAPAPYHSFDTPPAVR